MPADPGRRGVVRVMVVPRSNYALTKVVSAARLHRLFPARLLHLRTALSTRQAGAWLSTWTGSIESDNAHAMHLAPTPASPPVTRPRRPGRPRRPWLAWPGTSGDRSGRTEQFRLVLPRQQTATIPLNKSAPDKSAARASKQTAAAVREPHERAHGPASAGWRRRTRTRRPGAAVRRRSRGGRRRRCGAGVRRRGRPGRRGLPSSRVWAAKAGRSSAPGRTRPACRPGCTDEAHAAPAFAVSCRLREEHRFLREVRDEDQQAVPQVRISSSHSPDACCTTLVSSSVTLETAASASPVICHRSRYAVTIRRNAPSC